MVSKWKNEGIENILIFLLFVWLGVRKWSYEKNECINLLIYTLIKIWCPIKTKM